MSPCACLLERLAEFGRKPHRIVVAHKSISWASIYWYMNEKKGYGFIEFEISNSTTSTVLRQPLITTDLHDQWLSLWLFVVTSVIVFLLSPLVLVSLSLLLLLLLLVLWLSLSWGAPARRDRPRGARTRGRASPRPPPPAPGRVRGIILLIIIIVIIIIMIQLLNIHIYIYIYI